MWTRGSHGTIDPSITTPMTFFVGVPRPARQRALDGRLRAPTHTLDP